MNDEKNKKWLTFSFGMEAALLPDGTLDEEAMIEQALSKVADINSAEQITDAEDTLIGFTFRKENETTVADVTFQTVKDIDSEYLDSFETYLWVRNLGR